MTEWKLARCVLGVSAALVAEACSGAEVEHDTPLGEAAIPLVHDSPSPRAKTPEPEGPAEDYTLFEADPVRPIAVLEQNGLVLVANTFDDQLELFTPGKRGLKPCGSIKVGMRPVAVAVIAESARSAELWVVNHLSDSISVVRVDPRTCSGSVTRTLDTGDEPRDIVLTKNRKGQPRVFVTTAHRGQNHPLPSARAGTDLVTPPEAKAAPGLADVFVFDPKDPAEPVTVVNLFTDVPRALAVGDGVVYAAGFRTGNRTTVVPNERVARRGLESLEPLLAKDPSGAFVERNGELLLGPGERGRARIAGGMPAVSGRGRCMPDPRPERRDPFVQQVCVKTDARQRVLNVYPQTDGVVQADCQCTSGDGTLQPTSAAIVKFYDQARDCGEDYTRFPDGSRGCWLDAAPGGADSPARGKVEQAPPMAWNADVRFSLPDEDVFAIDVERLQVTRAFAGVGTVLFGMAVQPRTGKLFVTNTDAHNLTRFEGSGDSASSSVIGHLYESRVTVIEPARGRVQPVHLNTHIDYSKCCDENPRESQKSFAFPTAGAFSPDGETFFFTALGSDKIGIVKSSRLGAGFDNALARRERELGEIVLGHDLDDAAGPVGLTLDAKRGRLYVKTHLSNELVVVDPAERRVIERLPLFNPEPASIKDGRAILYDARLTSSHGDSACGSCHVFGDLDGLAWDLGDPDAETVNNPGPFTSPSELAALPSIARDPSGQNPLLRPLTPDFRSNKGPMTTQTLRGMANHGAQHWRGDRTRRFQDEPGRQPSFGSLDEHSSFGEFDVAIAGLNGNSALLDADVFERFTDFSLQLTLPPNPVRALDDSLDARQMQARALYFGCASMSDEQYDRRECVTTHGSIIDIDAGTQDCSCAQNPLVSALHGLPAIQGFAGLLRALFANDALRAAFDARAADPSDVPADAQAALAGLTAAFRGGREQLSGAGLALDADGLLAQPAAAALAQTSGALLGILELSHRYETATGDALLTLLASSIPPDALPPDSPLRSTAGLRATFEAAFAVSNLNLRTLADEAARGTGEFHDLLQGCDPRRVYACELRVTDSFETCHGCHTLDVKGNAAFGVYRPGFFGTSGEYTFENESQVFKVPHLRNMYAKTGMFGTPTIPQQLPESVLGANRGGFFALENRFMGPQIRGTGFLHDGSTDTLHRFHGGAVFAARTPGTIGDADPGNAGGFDAVLPAAATRDACVERFRSAPPAALDSLAPEQQRALALCREGSGVPDVCFLEPHDPSCEQTLAQIAVALADPEFPATFTGAIRPGCFQLGSMLEGGAAEGACFPEGLREREAMESFMLAFDSNMKPSVGQQVTVSAPGHDDPKLVTLLGAAERGHCDLALRQRNTGYLVSEPVGHAPARSQLSDAKGHSLRLGSLRVENGPVTFTCYPPHPRRAEARRAAFGR